jgi:predicted RNA-binding protein associated with RNAse of E/G family
MPERILEVKRHLDGREEVWECDRVLVTPNEAVIRFEIPVDVPVAPAGTQTFGFFWRWRTYNLYHFVSPEGTVLGHRFDVVSDVRIAPDRIRYLDLILDVLVAPDETVTVEDQGDVDRAVADGLLTPKQVQTIERTRDLLVRSHAQIVHEAVRTLQT